MDARPLALIAALLALGSGCSRQAGEVPEVPVRRHEHHPPHGGTPVVLGKELYHLELVRDAASGRLQAYVLDGEMENFVRIAAASIRIDATVAGAPHTVTLSAVANPETGETVGDTAAFEGQADWLRQAGSFEATVAAVTVRGTAFAAVAFSFPKGNDTD